MKKKKNKVKEYLPLYLMMLPGLLYLLINNYLPMTGIILAFKKLNFSKGILALGSHLLPIVSVIISGAISDKPSMTGR